MSSPRIQAASSATRLQLGLAFLLSLLAALPFVAKPVHQDDWAYLRVAQLLKSHPDDLLAQMTIYQGMPISAGEGILHGPVWIHTLAFALGFGDHGILVAHLITALCLALLGLAIASLAGRFGLPPLVSALLVTLSPVPLVLAGNLMTDLPMLALFASAMALAARGVESGSKGSLVAAGLCAALASLTRYHGMAVLPMLLAFAVLWPRDRFAEAWRARRSGLLWSLVPFALGTVIVAGFLVRTAMLKGEADSARAVDALEALKNIDRQACILAALAAVGGTVLGLFVGLLTAPQALLQSLLRSHGLKLVVAVGLGLGLFASTRAEARDALQPAGANLELQRLLFVMGGLALLLALRTVWRGTSPGEGGGGGFGGWRDRHGHVLLLFFWFTGYLVAAWVTVPFGSTRYALPALPAATLFVILFASGSVGTALGRVLWVALVPTALIGFGAAVADLHAAEVYPEFAARVAARRAGGEKLENANLWIWGELDFRWYLEESPDLQDANDGGPPRVLKRTSNAPAPGDRIFKSAVCTASRDGLSGTYQLEPALVQRMKNEAVEVFDDPWPIRIHNSYVAAGFYGAEGGLLPFAWASAANDDSLADGETVPHDRIQTWAIDDANPFFTAFPNARIETTNEITLAAGNITVEPFLVSHGVDLGIEMKTAVSIIFPGRVTWEDVPIGKRVERLELFVAEHDRTAFMAGPGAVCRVRINGEVAAELTIDSRRDEKQRRWLPLRVDLTPYQGQSVSISFEATEGPWPDKPADAKGPPPISVGFAEPVLR
jgi:hypothetical protein